MWAAITHYTSGTKLWLNRERSAASSMYIWGMKRERVTTDRESLIPRTSDDALLALRQALEENTRDAVGLSRVREPLRLLCRCAKREGVEPEHLLIRLKHTMDDVPGLKARTLEEQSDLRVRIVSFAIDAYFSEALEHS